jgi:hypothetical protein
MNIRDYSFSGNNEDRIRDLMRIEVCMERYRNIKLLFSLGSEYLLLDNFPNEGKSSLVGREMYSPKKLEILEYDSDKIDSFLSSKEMKEGSSFAVKDFLIRSISPRSNYYLQIEKKTNDKEYLFDNTSNEYFLNKIDIHNEIMSKYVESTDIFRSIGTGLLDLSGTYLDFDNHSFNESIFNKYRREVLFSVTPELEERYSKVKVFRISTDLGEINFILTAKTDEYNCYMSNQLLIEKDFGFIHNALCMVRITEGDDFLEEVSGVDKVLEIEKILRFPANPKYAYTYQGPKKPLNSIEMKNVLVPSDFIDNIRKHIAQQIKGLGIKYEKI